MGDFLHQLQASMVQSAQYQNNLLSLKVRCDDAFTYEELDIACKAVMSHYTSTGLTTMQRLLRGEKAIVRDFIRELGKIL